MGADSVRCGRLIGFFMVWLCSFNTCWANAVSCFRSHGICQEEAIREKRSPAAWWRLGFEANQKALMMAFDDCNQLPWSLSAISIFILFMLRNPRFPRLPSMSCMIFIPLHGPGRGGRLMEKYFSTPLWAEVVTP